MMTPFQAYNKALDKGPSDTTRAIACENAYWAYMYALDVDRGPRDDTRRAACRDAAYAHWYARDVDEGPRPDTRKAASREAYWKRKYETAFPADRLDFMLSLRKVWDFLFR